MLIKLTPGQVPDYWEMIKAGLQESLPPFVTADEGVFTSIMAHLVTDHMQVFLVVDDETQEKVYAVAVTTITRDVGSDTRTLLLYSLHGQEKVQPELWASSLVYLKRFAEAHGCTQITAYTDIPEVVKLARKLGAEARFFLTFDV